MEEDDRQELKLHSVGICVLHGEEYILRLSNMSLSELQFGLGVSRKIFLCGRRDREAMKILEGAWNFPFQAHVSLMENVQMVYESEVDRQEKMAQSNFAGSAEKASNPSVKK